MNLHSGMITSVECRFCFVFSRKSKPGAKRVKSTNYKNFDPIFWPEKNHTHLKLEHPQRWEAYQRLSAVKKFVYFEITIPFANTIVSYVDTEKYALTFFLYQSIVEILIWDMLWSPDDVDSQTHDNAMRIFVHDLELDNFSTTAKTPLALKMTVKYAGIGLSLRQTALALQIVKDTACVSKIGGMNELKVATFIRIQCTVNFQIIANNLQNLWALFLAFDGSTCLKTLYVDIRVCFVWQRQLYNVHVVSVSFLSSYTGLAQYEMLSKLFFVLSPD